MNKVPLRYQATEFDCGCAAVINAINYVLDFSEIPPCFLKEVYDICLDEYNKYGVLGGDGTSQDAMKFLVSWFNRYSKKTGFPIQCSYYEGTDVTLINNSEILNLLRDEATAIVIRCMLYDEHYITLTDVDENFIYAFDPYYWNIDFGSQNIIRIDEPFKANRKFPINFMDTTMQKYYNLNMIQEKIAVVFSRKEVRE